jgi:hypothetical protein
LWLVAGGWFFLREKYCWLVADKPSEQAAPSHPNHHPSQSTEESYGVGRGQVSIHVTTTLPSLHLPIQTVLIANMNHIRITHHNMNSSSVHTSERIDQQKFKGITKKKTKTNSSD